MKPDEVPHAACKHRRWQIGLIPSLRDAGEYGMKCGLRNCEQRNYGRSRDGSANAPGEWIGDIDSLVARLAVLRSCPHKYKIHTCLQDCCGLNSGRLQRWKFSTTWATKHQRCGRQSASVICFSSATAHAEGPCTRRCGGLLQSLRRGYCRTARRIFPSSKRGKKGQK
jgi:hypothetical protein